MYCLRYSTSAVPVFGLTKRAPPPPPRRKPRSDSQLRLRRGGTSAASVSSTSASPCKVVPLETSQRSCQKPTPWPDVRPTEYCIVRGSSYSLSCKLPPESIFAIPMTSQVAYSGILAGTQTLFCVNSITNWCTCARQGFSAG